MAGSLAESFRAREAQKYRYSFVSSHPSLGALQPFPFVVPFGVSSRKKTPSTALTAWLQLITLRLGVQRAMISLIDKDEQVFLAESTSKTRLDQGSSSEDDQADLWLGCSSTSRQEALCAHTIKVSTTAGSNPFFGVEDLKHDARFCNLPYVKYAPYFRSYGGVPLVTPAGSRIGAVLVLDDRPNRRFTVEEIDFLTVIASNVMSHLEMLQQDQSRKRHVLMARGIAAFVEQKNCIPREQAGEEPQDTFAASNSQQKNASTDKCREITHSGSSSTTDETSSVPITPLSVNRVLGRASNILRESLNVDYVVFYDAGSSWITTRDTTAQILRNTFSYEDNHSGVPDSSEDRGDGLHRRRNTTSKQASQSYAWSKDSSEREPTRILSFSGRGQKDQCARAQQNLSSSPAFSRRFVRKLQRRCQNGVIWSFEADGTLSAVETNPLELDSEGSSSSDGSNDRGSMRSNDSDRTGQREASTVIKNFPGARQILFVPFPNSGQNYSSVACFAISMHEVPIFTTDVEIAFVRAFLINVAAELDRIESSRSNRQKGDFISSISHELRTPLHGILAATEALQECAVDSKQQDLCETLIKCGRTLHTTITHVLDYSKINTLQRIENAEGQDFGISAATAQTQMFDRVAGDVPSLPAKSRTNIALIIEEVVQTASEKRISNIHSPDGVDTPVRGATEELPPRSLRLSRPQNSSLEVIPVLDIGHSSWTFMCAPEAIKRILEDLIDNSWKYTSTGFIKIEVSKYDQDQALAPTTLGNLDIEVVIIKVIDTGKGIASIFLDKELFTPFSQESSLSEGIGLGLSMVKGIVDSLHGTVQLGSVPDAGTVIEVRLPLKRVVEFESASAPGVKPVPGLLGHQSEIDQARTRCSERTVELLGFDLSFYKPLRDSIQHYIQSWFGAKVVSPSTDADILILNMLSFQHAANLRDVSTLRRSAILCCHTSDLANLKELQSRTSINLVPLIVPFGPSRFAKVLLDFVQGTASMNQERDGTMVFGGNVPSISTPVPPPSSAKPLHEPNKLQSSDDKSSYEPHSPLVRENETPRKTQSASPKTSDNGAAPRDSSSQPRILCVDDNDVNLKILTRYMSKLQLEHVETARDGHEAYQSFERQPQGFDIVFMDLSMPVWDGFESTRAIRKLEKQRRRDSPTVTPTLATIIVVTALGSHQDRENAFSAGADVFLTKPLKLADVRRLMEDRAGDKDISHN